MVVNGDYGEVSAGTGKLEFSGEFVTSIVSETQLIYRYIRRESCFEFIGLARFGHYDRVVFNVGLPDRYTLRLEPGQVIGDCGIFKVEIDGTRRNPSVSGESSDSRSVNPK